MFVMLLISVVLTSGLLVVLKNDKIIFASQPAALSDLQATTSPSESAVTEPALSPPPEKLANPPSVVKAVFVTGYSAGSKQYLNYLTNLFKTTQINAVVIDIKGSDGHVTYDSTDSDVQQYHLSDNAIPDIDTLINFLHGQNIYVIGRITVFEDPQYSKARPDLAIYDIAKTTDKAHPVLWKNANGVSWMDPASKDVWNYDIGLAKDGFSHGFDEVNFDYVRFPSDGDIDNMGFPVWDEKTPMADVIKSFFEYTRSQLAGEVISADLFGQTTVSTNDMGIGQIIENAFENFNYIAPMTYPSLYATNFDGFAKPAEHPYDVIKYCLDTAVSRENTFASLLQNQPVDLLAKFRPWLQDYNIGAVYDAPMVEQEIQGTEDALKTDYSGFMLWNAANVYTAGAVAK